MAAEALGRALPWLAARAATPYRRFLEMLVQAIEAGYATALHDLRAGRLDDAVREWRPDLITG